MLYFTLKRKKDTVNTVCFRDYRDLVGKIYVPNELIEELGIKDKLAVDIAGDIDDIPKDGKGYVSRFQRSRETIKKVRYDEEVDILKAIYISKNLVQEEGLPDEIVVRIYPARDLEHAGSKNIV